MARRRCRFRAIGEIDVARAGRQFRHASHEAFNQMPDGHRKLTRLPPVTAPARIELAEILLEPAPTPFWRALRQIGVDRAVGVLPRHHFDWREARVDMPWDYVPLRDLPGAAGGGRPEPRRDRGQPAHGRDPPGPAGRDEEIEIFCTPRPEHGPARHSRALLQLDGRAELAAHVREPGPRRCAGHRLRPRAGRRAPTRAGVVAERAARGTTFELLPGARRSRSPRRPACGSRCIPTIRRSRRCAASSRIMIEPRGFRARARAVPTARSTRSPLPGQLHAHDRRPARRDPDFGGERRIAFVHFRDVRGTPSDFVETFHDEGQTDMLACMRAYRDIGFDGVLRHRPRAHARRRRRASAAPDLARLHAIGYMQGLRDRCRTGTAGSGCPA